MRFVVIICVIFFALTADKINAQMVSIKILRNDNLEVLPFVNVNFTKNNFSITSDSSGTFSFYLQKRNPDDSINISAIGYKPYQSSLMKIVEDKTIFLEPKIYEIKIVEISALSVVTLYKQALKNTIDHIGKRNYYNEAFYRQYHIENNNPAFLAEALISVSYPDVNHALEKVNVKHLKRSENKEQNKEQHGDHLIDLLAENPLLHPSGTIFNKAGISYYEFKFDTTAQQNDSLIRILYFQKSKSTELFEYGNITINTKSNRIISFERSEKLNPSFPFKNIATGTNKFTWKRLNSKTYCEFKLINDSAYLDKISKSYKHELIDNIFNTVDYVVEENFELYNDAAISFTTKVNYKLTSDLYSAKCDVNEDVFNVSELYKSHIAKENLWEYFEKDEKALRK